MADLSKRASTVPANGQITVAKSEKRSKTLSYLSDAPSELSTSIHNNSRPGMPPRAGTVRHIAQGPAIFSAIKDRVDNSVHSAYVGALGLDESERSYNPKKKQVNSTSTDDSLEASSSCGIILPWSKGYKWWWGFTVFGAVLTALFEPYQMAFASASRSYDPNEPSDMIVELLLVSIFVVDMLVNFSLAYFDEERDVMILDRKLIANHYIRKGMFWIDLIGIVPFYAIGLAIAGDVGENTKSSQYIALLRLIRLVRLHRVAQLFTMLQYKSKISLMWLTLTRNFSVALIWTHFNACVMYFIARQHDFAEGTTWLGSLVNDLNVFERYIVSLYWSIVTFATVGYGDFSPANSAEQIWGMIYIMLNIIFQSWMIGSITLLIVKQDAATGDYRDTLKVLDQYSTIHDFDKDFRKNLKKQLQLEFNNREISDEKILSHFPNAVRRKVLRRLYLPTLQRTSLMRGVRQQFVDAFLITCKVEIFSPGEEILQRGSISSDLFLLIDGVVRIMPSWYGGGSDERVPGGSNSIAESDLRNESTHGTRFVPSGEFINEVGFFTDSPQTDTVRTVTVCKTLTISQAAYKLIAQDHPGSAGRILQNLLAKVEVYAAELGVAPQVNLPKKLDILRAGSLYDNSDTQSPENDVDNTVSGIQTQSALTSIQDLIKMHILKQKDDHTTRFLFAASRGDTSIVTLMCDQGFDPNNSDYDNRTALMVAAMQGNAEVIQKLLDFGASTDLIDVHGTSALYEAVRNGNESCIEVLLKHDGKLCMSQNLAASIMCQTVYDGDIASLRRLLRAGIQVNAYDYDKRTATHIAAAEGNMQALKTLVEFGADLKALDRWDNSIYDEAKRAKAMHVVEYLESLGLGASGTGSE